MKLYLKFFHYIKKNYLKLTKILIIVVFVFLLILGHYYVFAKANSKEQKQTQSDQKVLKVGIVNTLGLTGFDVDDKAPNGKQTINGGKISGTDVFLFEALAKKIGAKLEITVVDKDGMLTNLNIDKYDVISSGHNYTEERADNYDVEKMYKVDVAMLIKTKNKDTFKKFKVENGQMSLFDKPYPKLERKIKLTTWKNSEYSKKIEKEINEIKKIKGNNTPFEADESLLSLDNNSRGFYNIIEDLADGYIIEDNLLSLEMELHNTKTEDKDQKLEMIKLSDWDLPEMGLFFKKGTTEKPETIQKELKDELDNLSKEKKQEIYTNAIEKSEKDYRYMASKRIEQNANIFKKIIAFAPSYGKPFLVSLIISIDGLFLGFLLGLGLVKAKYFNPQLETANKFLSYIKKTAAFLIDCAFGFFQAVPVLIQGLLFYFLILIITKKHFHIDFFITNEGIFVISLTVIILNTAVFLASTMLNHIKFLDSGQIEGSVALGMKPKQVFRYIIFSQSIKRTYPSIWSQFIVNIKDTALFSSIGLAGVIWQAKRNIATNGDTITPYLTISIIYIILVLSTNLIKKMTMKYFQ
ncbi:Amino acid ABC transporter permease component [Candidatus Phytoplasma australiense]|uniref:Amino acid ABC transporter permease component n=2 Tax=Phytoplasma australiense TaxID=59748 RepID=B1VA12_PHYAS|nr:transporter substrate-binding domain-containing protein [Candidatus Phytoplasma australiense]AGL90158.1 putative amino-acid ABC transporter permease protein ytmL [Strawberry lethal yellows phytoplasma (CPA) str. NZSb11]CAM11784.1 Amino acid ABC transporter permease component [Candidatus Phytoplasma australiense]